MISQISETHIALRNLSSLNRASKLASQTYWVSGLLKSRFWSAMFTASMVGTRARTPRTAIVGTTKTIGSRVPVFTATALSRMLLPTGWDVPRGRKRAIRFLGHAFALSAVVERPNRRLCQLLRFATKAFANVSSSSAEPLMSVRVPVTSSSSSMPQWSPRVGHSGSCQKLIVVTLAASTNA